MHFLKANSILDQQNQKDTFKERCKYFKEFQTRPLPPLPTSPKYGSSNGPSLFQVEKALNYSFDDYCKAPLGESEAIIDFEKMERHFSNNSSRESMYLIDYNSKRLNTFSEFRKHRSTISKTKQRNFPTIKRNRSNSMEDRNLAYNNNEEKMQDFRRSYSLDNLDESNKNNAYIDIRSCEELTHDQFQETCDSYLTDSTFTSPRDGGITSFTSLYNIADHEGENMYAKIPELPVRNEKIQNIQRRRLPPVPTLLDTCFMNQNPATMIENHIYQRASILNINSLLKSNYEKDDESEHLTGQLHSFRSTYSNASGQYAKIPEENGIKRASNLYTQVFESPC